MSQRFQKVVESFTCTQCARFVEGDGYTNHCPYCLWSKHVDVYPGDRRAGCDGMMEPVDVATEKGEQILTHRCTTCGHRKRNTASWRDDFEVILAIVKGK